MKANELQINDLVEYNGIVGRIYATSMPFPRKEERYNDKAIITLAVNGFIDALEEEISPIHLTAEILEKNGWWLENEDFYRHKGVDFLLWWYRGIWSVEIETKFGVEYHSFTDIHYVHELQHALRLCELNELANNFKI